MNRTASFAVALFATVALAAPSAVELGSPGQGRGRGHAAKPNTSEQKPQKAVKAAKKADKVDKGKDVAVVFDRDGHARVIRDYRIAGLPPGLAKRDSLPPGLRKQVRERGALPPGLQRHLVAVPDPLSSRLPGIPDHYRRYFAGDDLIVVDTRTNRIVAIMRDVLR